MRLMSSSHCVVYSMSMLFAERRLKSGWSWRGLHVSKNYVWRKEDWSAVELDRQRYVQRVQCFVLTFILSRLLL